MSPSGFLIEFRDDESIAAPPAFPSWEWESGPPGGARLAGVHADDMRDRICLWH